MIAKKKIVNQMFEALNVKLQIILLLHIIYMK